MTTTLEHTNGPRPLVLWGATGQARVLAEFVGRLGYRISAFIDRNTLVAPPVAGVPLFPDLEAWLQTRSDEERAAAGLVAIGGSAGLDRIELQRRLEDHDVEPVVAVHPAAYVASNATVRAGSQILARAVVGAEAKVGEACIVNTAASVDHECVLENGVHIGPGATLAGCVHVGAAAFIGTGAVVLPRLHIGARSIVGAGAIVTRDVPPDTVVYGNPARVKRRSEER